MNSRFLIFALPRCGSSTLALLLNCYPDIRCVIEPFNPKNPSPKNPVSRYLEGVKDQESMGHALGCIWQNFNGIKHCWDPSGYPFGQQPDLNTHLLLNCAPIVLFLSRRNYLRRLISLQIAVQTDVWFVLSEDDKRKCLNFKFRPIDLAEIKWRLESEKKAVHQYRQLLAESGVNFLEIWYEDLYDPALTP